MLGRHWEYGNARVVDRQVVRTGKHGSWSSTDRYHKMAQLADERAGKATLSGQ